MSASPSFQSFIGLFSYWWIKQANQHARKWTAIVKIGISGQNIKKEKIGLTRGWLVVDLWLTWGWLVTQGWKGSQLAHVMPQLA